MNPVSIWVFQWTFHNCIYVVFSAGLISLLHTMAEFENLLAQPEAQLDAFHGLTIGKIFQFVA
jgi:hypothetical protein